MVVFKSELTSSCTANAFESTIFKATVKTKTNPDLRHSLKSNVPNELDLTSLCLCSLTFLASTPCSSSSECGQDRLESPDTTMLERRQQVSQETRSIALPKSRSVANARPDCVPCNKEVTLG